jgi:membrane protein DedA with SNARE-associated domain
MNNLSSFPLALAFVQNNGYFILFFFMVFEGPMVTSVAAFAASMGLFNIYLIFALSLLGNIVGDLIYFSVGKIGRRIFVNRHLNYFEASKKKVQKLESIMVSHPIKALATIKLVPNLAIPGLILAGAVNMRIRKFLVLSFIISFVYSLFFSLAGFYLGMTFGDVLKYSHYAKEIIFCLILAVLIFFIIYNKFSKKVYTRLESSNAN